MANTAQQYDQVRSICTDIFTKKLHDYGPAWRILRPSSLTDQIYIKARRIRELEIKQQQQIDEGIESEFVGIINYALVALVQLNDGFADEVDLSPEQALERYSHYFDEAKALMLRKNHDYGEAWRQMRVSSYTDLILMKLQRTKQIEDLGGETLISEGIDANYYDMLNYSVFALIKLVVEAA